MGANGCGKEYADQLYSGDARTGQRRDSDRRQTGFPNTGLRNWPRESLLYRRFTSGLFPYTVEQVVLMGRNAYSRALSGPEGHRPENGKEGAGAHRYRASVAAPVYSYQRRRDAAGDAGQSSGTAYVGHYHG